MNECTEILFQVGEFTVTDCAGVFPHFVAAGMIGLSVATVYVMWRVHKMILSTWR